MIVNGCNCTALAAGSGHEGKPAGSPALVAHGTGLSLSALRACACVHASFGHFGVSFASAMLSFMFLFVSCLRRAHLASHQRYSSPRLQRHLRGVDHGLTLGITVIAGYQAAARRRVRLRQQDTAVGPPRSPPASPTPSHLALLSALSISPALLHLAVSSLTALPPPARPSTQVLNVRFLMPRGVAVCFACLRMRVRV